ncbi:MAG TPA: carbon-nitrogen hydrolase family protein [Cyclobacteriaceae bacterium]|nr:carbon-nitrogen hydrolase family protein [Cyclobacteriaceae bacterium]
MAPRSNRLPREVWAASISLRGLWPERSIEQRIKDVLARMEKVYAYEPDIICLPEIFQISWVEQDVTLDQIAESETTPGPVTSRLAEIARNQNCYVVCPIITRNEGHFYNSAILIDRAGKIAGIYHKAHPVDTEAIPDRAFKGGGTTPGVLNPSVFKTDFGTVGMQICFDASFFDAWQSLKAQGAEMILFPSQGPFGDILCFHAWLNRCCVVSSTGEDARIIDMTGDVVAADGHFARWACAPVNLEKRMINLVPHVGKFEDIARKYGRRISIKIYHSETWATVESRDPEIRVMDILQEFGIPTYDEELMEATKIQNKYRPK